ncbi:MAG: hypothetical protein JXR73_18235 [Candidatus Omnitrophica bacterium]|nr:hypothetical protein [Candidatus Omnitrophota bacterium]
MSITRINNNTSAFTANRYLNNAGDRLSQNIERLSSGLRINSAGDDAAGLTIRERLRTQIRGTDMAIRNAEDGINMADTTEASLDSLVSCLQRVRELAIQAGNTGSNDAASIQAIQDEVFQQIDEVNRIATTARYSSLILFTGDNANTSEIVKGQDDVGVSISVDPNASNLSSGTSILNIVRTNEGAENLLPSTTENGQAMFATGLKDATDIAVTASRFMNGANAAANADNLAGLVFGTVSIEANNTITFQGVLSDGATQFAGALSVGGNSMSDLISQIQTAIDNAETALFGGIEADIPANFVQTHVSIPSSALSEAEGSGRIRFLSAKSEGNSITTNADITDATSKFEISFNVINNAGNLKTEVVSTRDYVKGVDVGGQYGNVIQGITGSTFDTGNFGIEVTDIVPPNRRTVDTDLQFRDSAGAIVSRSFSLARGAVINGTFVNSVFTTGDTGIRFEADDTLTFQGTNADGTTFETVFTLSTDGADDAVMGDGLFATLSGLIQELNYRDRTRGVNGPVEQSAFNDATLTLTGEGTLRLIDDIAENSQSGLFMIIDEANGNGTLTDRAQVVLNGNPEMATISIDGGERIRVRVGEEATLTGSDPTLAGESTPQITLRIGAGSRESMSTTILNQGEDTLEVTAQEFVGSLNGGPEVMFQNGDQNVFFESGVSEGVAETLMIDFDAILDITGPPTDGSPNTGVAILISTVNNALNFQVGPFTGQDLQLNIPNLQSKYLGFGYGTGRSVADINVTTVKGVNDAIEIIDVALDQISRARSALGAFINRLETTVESLSTSSENLSASESRISDVDMASEVSDYSSNQILYQASTSVLAQANSLPQTLLSLLG